MSTRQEITDDAIEVIEPNLQFYRKDPSDETRYLVGPEVLSAIAWAVTNIALPILVSVSSSILIDQINEWLKKRRDNKDPTIQPPEAIRKELENIIESKNAISITNDQANEATQAVAEYLSYRGWPREFAVSDATQIIEAIRYKVRARS